MRIQELERKTDLERPTIRFYEQEGLISPKRTENGYREYSEEEVSQLLKIKLLRQLGMPVEKIRQLQQGSADLGQAMETQIAQLSSQIQEQKRARVICQTLRADGVDYHSLNAAHYLQLLRELPPDAHFPKKHDFQEDIPQEIHPWRRFFARTIDLLLFSMLIQFLIFVVFRLRPLPSEFLMTLMGIGYGFLYVPVEALLLHKWGTTPGKWAMGMHLEWIQGGNLPYWEAIYRSWRVLKYGMAFGIPFVQLGFQMLRYCQLTGTSTRRWRKYNEHIDPPTEMDWDDDTEIVYGDWEGKNRNRVLALAAAYLVLFAVTVFDCVKPAHRSNDLTIAQFAENYNSTVRLLDPYSTDYERLDPDGNHVELAGGPYVLYRLGIGDGGNRPVYTYDTDGMYLRSVTYENSWDNVQYMQPLYGFCQNAAITALLSQPGCGLRELWEFMILWERNLYHSTDGFTYGPIEVEWSMDYQNIYYEAGTCYYDDPNTPSELHVRFQLRIGETK